MQSKPKVNLAMQIAIALFLGVIAGGYLHSDPEHRAWIILNILKPAGDIFIHLIKMIVVPIVISTLIVGIAGVGGGKKFGRIGFKTIIYFEVVTTIAILIGISLANAFHPGSHIDTSGLAQTDITSYEKTTAEVQSHPHGLVNTIMSVIPTNVFSAMARGDMLAIIFFSVMFGLAISQLSEKHQKPIIDVLRAISETMFKVTNLIMRYAPIGVFGLISVTVANFGFESLVPLMKLVSLVYFSIFLFAALILGTISRLCGIRLMSMIKVFRAEISMAFVTSSSETVLPQVMRRLEAYGVPRSVVSFVIPTGYSFNLDGSALYQSIAALFIAQMYGIDMTITQQIVLVITLMITSKGIAAVPGASFVVLLATLSSVGLPLEGLAFIAGIDRIMDMARTALNLLGNALAAVVIAKWEGVFDNSKHENYVFYINHSTGIEEKVR